MVENIFIHPPISKKKRVNENCIFFLGQLISVNCHDIYLCTRSSLRCFEVHITVNRAERKLKTRVKLKAETQLYEFTDE